LRYKFHIDIKHLIVFYFFLSSALYSQSYFIQQYTGEDGLPDPKVNSVTQDFYGRMWFAAEKGVIVYDGYDWKIFDHTNSILSGIFIKIKTDSNGNIWALSEDTQISLFVYNGNGWLKLPPINSTLDRTFYFSNFDLIDKGETIKAAVISKGGGVFIYDDGEWKNFTEKDGLASSVVHDVCVVNEQFYFATDNGISIFTNDGFDNTFTDIPGLPSKVIIAVKPDGNKLWIMNRHALGYILNHTYHFVGGGFIFEQLPQKQYYSILPIDSNRIIFSNLYKLFHFDLRTRESGIFKSEDVIYADGSTEIYKDRENNIWISGHRGIGKISATGFKNFYKESGLFDNEVSAITERIPGQYVLGHNGGLTLLYNNKFSTIKLKGKDVFQTREDRVLDLCTDSHGNVWFAYEGSGFGRLNPDNQIDWFWANGHFAFSIESNSKGEIFAITGKNLLKYSLGSLNEIPLPPIFDKIGLRKIFFDRNDQLYIATINSGVAKQSDDLSWKIISSSTQKNANSIYSIFFNNSETLCGTQGGLYIIEADTLKKYYDNDFKIDIPVYFISKDGYDNLWFGTNSGVFKWDGTNYFQFTKKQGLAGIETNRDAGYADSFGNFWIGTSAGLSKYNEADDIIDVDTKPIVLLDSVTAGDLSLSLNEVNQISYQNNNLTFYFKGISFLNENDISYLIKLEGFDEDWILMSNSENPHVRYTNLPGGVYNFKVRTANSFGLWSDEVSSAEIYIFKPYYLQWWFFFLVLLGLTTAWYLGFKYHKRIKYTERLESEVLERTKQLDVSQKRYEQMFNANQAIMLLIDAATGKVIDANPSAVEYYGFDPKKLAEYNFYDIDNTLQSKPGSIIDLQSGVKKYYNSLHKTFDRKIRNVEVYLNSLSIDNKVLFYAIIHDITDRKMTEEALIESEEKYRLLVNNMQDGVVLVQEGRIIYSNKAFSDILGFPHGGLDGELIYDWVADDYKEILRINYEGRLKGLSVPSEYELKLKHKKGNLDIYVIINAGVFRYEGKMATIATLKNVTEKKHQDEKLRQLYTAVEQSPTSVIITNTEGIIEYVNPKCSEITGYRTNELVGFKSNFFKKDTLSPEVHKSFWDTITSGNVWRGELPSKRKDGSQLWIHTAIAPIKDSKGNITHFISIEDDITFEKFAREEIEKNERMLNSIVSNLPVVFFVLDKLGKITLAKGRSFETAGIKSADLIGKQSRNYFEGMSEINYDIERALNGEEFSSTVTFYGVQFEVTFVPIFDEYNNIKGTMGIAYDITERYNVEKTLKRAKEEAEKSDRLKSDFLAQMSHEIRTPINSILSFSSLLKEELFEMVSDQLKESFQIIEGGGRRLIRTIDLILNMSQIHTGTYQPIYSIVDLNKEVLSSVVDELKFLAENKNLKLEFMVDTIKTSIRGDKYTLGQIFINLVDNAIKYTAKGKITIRLYEKNGKLAIDIKDTGQGIAKEFIPKLFSPFTQEESGYTRKFEGTGLGLALVNKYVEINNGAISVDSKKGRGTVFTVIFNSKII